METVECLLNNRSFELGVAIFQGLTLCRNCLQEIRRNTKYNSEHCVVIIILQCFCSSHLCDADIRLITSNV